MSAAELDSKVERRNLSWEYKYLQKILLWPVMSEKSKHLYEKGDQKKPAPNPPGTQISQ